MCLLKASTVWGTIIDSADCASTALIVGSATFGPMDRFIVPAAASIVVGLLLGAAAIFGVTLMVQQDSKPPLQAGDPASSVLNRVEYGDRT